MKHLRKGGGWTLQKHFFVLLCWDTRELILFIKVKIEYFGRTASATEVKVVSAGQNADLWAKVKVIWLDRECGRESESYLARSRMWPVMFKLPLLLLLPLLLPQTAVKGLTLEGSSTSYAQVPVKKTSYPQVPKQLNGKSLFFHPVQEMVHWVQFFPRNGV